MPRLAPLPRALRSRLRLRSETRLGWLTNGALLRKAEQDFDVFITGDRNLIFQQQLSNHDIGVLVLRGESTRLRHTIQLMPQVLGVLPTIKPGELIQIGWQR